MLLNEFNSHVWFLMNPRIQLAAAFFTFFSHKNCLETKELTGEVNKYFMEYLKCRKFVAPAH